MSGETLQFWGLVAAISIIALAFLVIPLVRRRTVVTAVREVYDINVYKDQLGEIERDLDRGLLDDAQANSARIEIKRRMLAAADLVDDAAKSEDVDAGPVGLTSNLGLLSVIVLGLPAAAVAMYLYLGRPGVPDQPFADRPTQTQTADKGEPSDLGSVAEKLAKRLEANPDDLRGWMLLGRSYMSLGQFTKAASAYGRAYGISEKDAEIGAEYAEALSLASNSTITPLAKDVFDQTLATDPLNAKARFYLAMYKAQGGNIRGALQGWIDLIAISPADAPWYATVSQQVERASKELGIDPATIKPSPETAALAVEARRLRPQMTPTPEASTPGPSQADVEAADQMSGEDRQAMIRSMVNRLADRLKDNPDDKTGWQRLERAYRVLGETAKADEAAANAAKLP